MGSDINTVCVLAARQDHGAQLLQKLCKYQLEANLTDFKIVVKGREINVHKCVISSMCPYFETMIGSGMKESAEGNVTLDTLDYDVVTSIVDYFYGREVKFDCLKASEVIDACELLLLTDLKLQFTEHISNAFLSANNCLSLWKIAEKYHLESLATKCKQIMLSEFKEVCQLEEFMLLSFAEVKEYICEEIQCKRDDVLEAVLKWVSYDEDSRIEHVHALMVTADITKCSSVCLYQTNKTYKNILTNPAVRELIIDETTKRLYQAETRKSSRVFLLGGMEKYDKEINDCCWEMDFSDGDEPSFMWKDLMTIPSSLKCKQMTMVNTPDGFAVVCGGEALNTNSMYNWESKTWSDLPNTPVSIRNPSATFCDNGIYVLGGGTSGDQKHDVYFLDFAKSICEKQPNMKIYERWPIAGTLHRNIYVVSRVRRSCHTFQRGRQWEKCAEHPVVEGTTTDQSPLHGAQFIPIGELLYLVGGKYRICSYYDPGANMWTLLKRPDDKREFGATFSWKNKIYILGGNDKPTNTVEIYDIEKDTWEKSLQTIPKALCFAKAFAVST